MELNTGIEVLVVIISVVLGLFLIVSIVATLYIIKVLKAIKHLTDKAEQVAEKAENVTDFFKEARGPLSLLRVIKNVADMAQSKPKKGK